MKALILGSIALVSLVATAGAAPPDAELMVPIHQFIDGFNKGDQKSGAAAFARGSVSIIDEVAPHLWLGENALQAWSRDLAANDKRQGISDQMVTLGEPTRAIAEGNRGYVVVPATLTYKERGVAMRESAQMTYALKKGEHGWKISGWTWAGTTPQPDAAPVK